MTNKRFELLDTIRGITLISMILYHGVWDLVNLYKIDLWWFGGSFKYIWQQSICCTFIILSGFCWSLGKHHLKNGIMILGGGILVTAVTVILTPSAKIIFGVLIFIGSAVLLTIPLDRLLKKIPSEIGVAVSLVLFIVTRNCNDGYLGFESLKIVQLPSGWYKNLLTAYFGFPSKDFFSADYFSLFPWIFLFVFGYFLFGVLNKRNLNQKLFSKGNVPIISFMGRHSLLIYLLHQPILYVICMMLL